MQHQGDFPHLLHNLRYPGAIDGGRSVAAFPIFLYYRFENFITTTASMREKKSGILLATLILAGYASTAQHGKNEVKVVGQMRNVMWKGQLEGTIHLDTITRKNGLYGLGPVEFLAGEILIIDGKSYKSTAINGASMKVEETYDIKAPFFGYACITAWREKVFPDTIQTIPQLEQYLDKITRSSPRPFLFRLEGIVEKATIHIVDLPKGTQVRSPQDAHKGQKNYTLNNTSSDIIGFFSTEHKAIFTHHDTFVHMHLVTADRKQMGHLDEVLFRKGSMKLYLPME
jgi:acetolactate decarboxylase